MSKISVIVPVYNVENYIRGMLESVMAQTFDDFEVVIINDGSPDDSQKIIDEFCAADKRFKSYIQENGGVAAARNNGIEKAEGDYLVFYDPDDYIPKNALKKMYKIASSKNADVVVGIMEEISLGESFIYMHSQALAKQKMISPVDPHFTGAWSVCHKMFSRKLIIENDLRFEKMSNAEDGVFTYRALNYAKNIAGCKDVAYNYLKRPFWLEASATQIISSEYLDGLIKSHERILEEAQSLVDKYLNGALKTQYMNHLYERFIEGEMIKGYYRNIWRGTDDLIERIADRTAHYRQFITDTQWNDIVKRHKDLELEKGFMTKDILAEIPFLTIVITVELEANQIDLVLGSIYNQQFQRFEVLMPKYNEQATPSVYIDKPNLHIIDMNNKSDAVGCAKGRYVTFIDEFALYTKGTLVNMISAIESQNVDFVSMLVKHYDGKEFSPIPCLNGAYGYSKKSRHAYDKLTECDTLFSNKVFNKDAIDRVQFTDDPVEDIKALYKTLNFIKLRKGLMITTMSQEEIIARIGNIATEKRAERASKRNQLISVIVSRIKKHINKEDVKRIKAKFIK